MSQARVQARILVRQMIALRERDRKAWEDMIRTLYTWYVRGYRPEVELEHVANVMKPLFLDEYRIR